MDDVKITCVSDWLPIKYEDGEPFVLYNGEQIWIRDYVRFEDKPQHRTIDFDEYTREDRFPRFVEVWTDGTRVRLWSVVTTDKDDRFLETTLEAIEVDPSIVSILRIAKIVTVGDLLKVPINKLDEIADGDTSLFNTLMSIKGDIENIVNE